MHERNARLMDWCIVLVYGVYVYVLGLLLAAVAITHLILRTSRVTCTPRVHCHRSHRSSPCILKARIPKVIDKHATSSKANPPMYVIVLDAGGRQRSLTHDPREDLLITAGSESFGGFIIVVFRATTQLGFRFNGILASFGHEMSSQDDIS